MAEDTPAQKKRRPRAELKELMIEGGVEVLAEHGVQTQISSVSYAKVFEHLERSQDIRVTYGSVHERIWNSLQEYQLAVIERAGVWKSEARDDVRLAQSGEMLANADLSTTAGAQRATRETARILAAGYLRTAAETDNWGQWLETVTALKSGPTGSPITEAARDGAVASYEHQTDIYRQGRWEALKMASATPNELVPDDTNVEDILAAISIAITDGIELRRYLTDEPVPSYRLKTGPNGEEEEGNLFALAAYASIEFLANVGPDHS
jgi:hypothetical protein